MGRSRSKRGRAEGGVSPSGNRNLGARGEERAAAYLKRKGLRIVDVNYRCRLGEIDIVATEGETVVIVEVKSKRSRSYGTPEEMITLLKKQRLTSLARIYLRNRGWEGRPARFDVVAIDWSEGSGGLVRYYRNAFAAVKGW